MTAVTAVLRKYRETGLPGWGNYCADWVRSDPTGYRKLTHQAEDRRCGAERKAVAERVGPVGAMYLETATGRATIVKTALEVRPAARGEYVLAINGGVGRRGVYCRMTAEQAEDVARMIGKPLVDKPESGGAGWTRGTFSIEYKRAGVGEAARVPVVGLISPCGCYGIETGWAVGTREWEDDAPKPGRVLTHLKTGCSVANPPDYVSAQAGHRQERPTAAQEKRWLQAVAEGFAAAHPQLGAAATKEEASKAARGIGDAGRAAIYAAAGHKAVAS